MPTTVQAQSYCYTAKILLD